MSLLPNTHSFFLPSFLPSFLSFQGRTSFVSAGPDTGADGLTSAMLLGITEAQKANLLRYLTINKSTVAMQRREQAARVAKVFANQVSVL
jgi:hypothetical protein